MATPSRIDPYAALGVGHGADAATIKRAHRRLAKQAHPDIGGDPAVFARVQLAYEVLSDPERRKRYDETGEIDDRAANPDAAAWGFIFGLLQQILAQDEDPVFHDLVPAMLEIMAKELASYDDNERKFKRAAARAKRMAPRWRRKAGENMVSGMLEQHARNIEAMLKKQADQRKALERARELVREHTYTPEQLMQAASANTYTAGTNTWR